MKKILQGCLVFLLIIPISFAMRVDSLYQGSAPVASQSEEDRNEAAKAALGEVLIKLSGDTHALSNPQLKAQLTKAPQLIEEFSYQPAVVPDKGYIVQINFDPKAVKRILQGQDLQIWGQDRPLILMWIDYEVPGKPGEIIDESSTHPIALFLKKYADKRGLPVMFPVMDMTELKEVPATDIASMAVANMQNASKRYEADAILLGRVVQLTSGFISAQWKLILGNAQWNWASSGKTSEEVVAPLINNIADTLAGRYAVVVSNDTQLWLTIKIMGVTEQNDLGRITEYLQRLSPVYDVQLSQVSGEEVTLNIMVQGNRQTFVRAISGDPHFIPQEAEEDATVFTYQWKP